MAITYKNISCAKMSEKQIADTSKLFSENYGFWSSSAPKANQPIRFGPGMIKKSFVSKPDCNVALAYDGDELVGHIFYIRRKGAKTKSITWMLQLVVKKTYRGQNIGGKMMHSIWELSDSYAWGLYTSNPMTIKTLEQATMRPINPKLIRKHLDKLKEVSTDLFPTTDWIDGYDGNSVNTNFRVSHEHLNEDIKKAYPNDDFPLGSNLPEGHEWLAFTFKSQEPTLTNPDSLEQYLMFSQDVLNQAYSRMKILEHPWARHASKEVAFFKRYLPAVGMILDIGCAVGRHSIELAKQGYQVLGFDFSAAHIAKANQRKTAEGIVNATFICADARTFKAKQKADAAFCLYDVVGSYPDENDNYNILRMAYKNLKPGGTLILSVMNMELTKKRAKAHIVSGIEQNFDKLLALEGSNLMQRSGDIFAPKYLLIDDTTGIVYRKEQFFDEESLPIEYTIRDRRYTSKGIQSLVRRAGFIVKECYYVQAGHFETPLLSTSDKAKEILVIAQKDTRINALFNRLVPKENTWR